MWATDKANDAMQAYDGDMRLNYMPNRAACMVVQKSQAACEQDPKKCSQGVDGGACQKCPFGTVSWDEEADMPTMFGGTTCKKCPGMGIPSLDRGECVGDAGGLGLFQAILIVCGIASCVLLAPCLEGKIGKFQSVKLGGHAIKTGFFCLVFMIIWTAIFAIAVLTDEKGKDAMSNVWFFAILVPAWCGTCLALKPGTETEKQIPNDEKA
jgi:hypothetical protein